MKLIRKLLVVQKINFIIFLLLHVLGLRHDVNIFLNSYVRSEIYSYAIQSCGTFFICYSSLLNCIVYNTRGFPILIATIINSLYAKFEVEPRTYDKQNKIMYTSSFKSIISKGRKLLVNLYF